MRLTKKMVTSFAIVGAMAVLAPGTAHAAPGAAAVVVVGGGTISPGLTPDPTMGAPQTVSFTGQAAGVAVGLGPSVVADGGLVNCSFTGGSGAITLIDPLPLVTVGDNLESSAEGSGTVTGNCTGTGVLGHSVNAACRLDYLRVGPLVV